MVYFYDAVRTSNGRETEENHDLIASVSAVFGTEGEA
jgi:hypothetical protein